MILPATALHNVKSAAAALALAAWASGTGVLWCRLLVPCLHPHPQYAIESRAVLAVAKTSGGQNHSPHPLGTLLGIKAASTWLL